VHVYLLFLLMAGATVLSPGPGVVMTLSNALRFGARGTMGGVLGIATGALVVAVISATSLGVLLATSAAAFTALKFIGAAYLVYLGIRLWRAPPLQLEISAAGADGGFGKRFVEGITMQLTNPKVVLFFLSIFPQFIDPSASYAAQFAVLVLTYCLLVVGIHLMYAVFARRAKRWLTSARGGRIMNRAAGTTFFFFGGVLATASR